jgi:integrase
MKVASKTDDRTGTKSWQVIWTPKPGASRKFKQFPTKAAADAFSYKTSSAIYNRTHIADSDTVGAAAQIFLDEQRERVSDGEISPKEFSNHEGRIRLHLAELTYDGKPLLETQLTELTINGVKKQIARQLKQRLATKTCVHVLTTLKQICDAAISEDPPLLATNPVKVSAGKQKGKTMLEKENFSHDLAARLVEFAPAAYRLHIRFAIQTGLRASEQRALRWSDLRIDDDTGHYTLVNVRRKIQPETKSEIDVLKSRAGYRSVPIDVSLSNALKAHKLAQNNFDHIFATSEGGVGDNDNWRNRGIAKAAKAAGVKIKWIELRHYFASALVKQSFDKWQITKLMGHESIKTTEDHYLHWIDDPEADAAAAIKIGQAFNFGS